MPERTVSYSGPPLRVIDVRVTDRDRLNLRKALLMSANGAPCGPKRRLITCYVLLQRIISFNLLRDVRSAKWARAGHLGGLDSQNKPAASPINRHRARAVPRRAHAANDHIRLLRRRGHRVIPRCHGHRVGEPVADRQPNVVADFADP
jgi:hypothetical protein